jgi:hypothetical protein
LDSREAVAVPLEPPGSIGSMRRALAWMTGIVGIAALARLLHRRRHAAEPAEPPAADPAEDLRRALAEQRVVEPEPVVAPAAEEPEPSPDERRADVHARGESAIARMREGDDSS